MSILVKGVSIGDNIKFADDTALMAESIQDLQILLDSKAKNEHK